MRAHIQVTKDVLDGIGAGQLPSLLILNKIDAVDTSHKALLTKAFPEAMVMLCEHQPFHGKAARVSRVFVKRDGQWQMAVSFQTTRQDAAVKTI